MSRVCRITFLRGTGRCGSKMLARCIGEHAEIAHVPANECLPEELIDHCECTLQRRIPAAPGEALRAGVRGFFEAYCQSQTGNAGHLLHKSTGHARHLDQLLDLWPDARLIYVVRHPLDVVRSMISADIARFRGANGYQSTVLNSALQWANETILFLASRAARDPRTLLVRFDDVLNDPAGSFEAIWRHLDVEASVRPDIGRPAGYGDSFQLSARESQWLLDVTADLTAALGYEARGVDAGADHGHAATNAARRLVAPIETLDGRELLARAIQACQEGGAARIGLYGAGTAARNLATRWPDEADALVGIFDDNPALHGAAIGGVPVHLTDEAPTLGVDAVIPMTYMHEAALAARWRQRFGDAVRVVGLTEASASIAEVS